MKKVTLKSLKLDDDIDGISFAIDRNADGGEWTFSMMRLSDKESQKFHLTDMGFKYQILLYKKNKAEYFEAIIGDLSYYVKNLLMQDQEGIILKKCAKSEEILNKILRRKLERELVTGLIQVAEQKS